MKKYLLLGVLLVSLSLVLSVTYLQNNISACILVAIFGVIILFFAIFETKKVACEKIVLIALLSSLASVGRVIFASIPSVQPSSFIIMITGIVFGGEVGFLTGAITALSSNLLLGQGPWTVWQMFCWGMMGFISGVLAKPLTNNKILFILYGLLWGFVFGWIMNGWYFVGYIEELNLATFLTACISSFPMDLAHGIANMLLIDILGARFIKIFGRISQKYGLRGDSM